jgi:hypothetical protein
VGWRDAEDLTAKADINICAANVYVIELQPKITPYLSAPLGGRLRHSPELPRGHSREAHATG